ncbi:MAG: NAD(P)H-dependent oxidoreductase [Sulfurovum sp.]|nr:NAD(P)H-dependent oxidoreductase [Sulfurovum sp.]
MKNVLMIISHPREESLTVSMANLYKEASEKVDNNIEVLDLYRCEKQQPFLTYKDDNGITQTDEMSYFQEKIGKADEIVFFFPYWWGSMPAILKNFIDWNLSKDFAFTYENGRPKGLLSGKTVKIFTTTGAPKFIYALTGANRRLKNMFKEQIVEFCGMKLESCNIYGGVDTSGKNVEKILSNIPTKV